MPNIPINRIIEINPNIIREVGGLVGSTGSVAPPAPSNPDFTVRFDPNIFAGALTRVTRTIVVSQDPSPGDFVPAGTPITVTVVEKSLIPTKSFNGLAPATVAKYPNIGTLEDDLSNPNDALAKNAKSALDKGVPIAQMSDADKAALAAFAANRLGTAVDATKGAADLAFLYQL
ncbi:MAG TPA: PASTA domain-containing protein [Bryobacteraceae bacterium]|jgi:hypothetical protein|nr:PASTA domain-containing protein [Bryobacteraceae bacterium]